MSGRAFARAADRRRPDFGEPRPRRAFLTVEEVAELLRVDAVTIYRAIRAGGFPAVKIRKRYVIPRRAIDLLVEEVVATGSCVDTAAWTSSLPLAGEASGGPPRAR